MKKALRTLLALVVAAAMIGGGFAGSAAATDDYNTISDDDLVDLNANVGNPVTSVAVNAGNIGSGDQTAVSDVNADYSAGDDLVIND